MEDVAPTNFTGVQDCLDISPGERYENTYIVATRALVDTIIVLFIISSNSFIVIAILRYRYRRKGELSAVSSASVRFALNLSIADLLVGISTVSYLGTKYVCSLAILLSKTKQLCLLMFLTIISAHATSAYTTVAIAIDRYVAVVHALRYREIMSTRKSRIMLGVVWTFSMLVSLPVAFWNDWRSATKCEEIFVVPPAYIPAITLFSHCVIMGIVASAHRRIHCEAQASNRRKMCRNSGVVPPKPQDGKYTHRFTSKSAKVMMLVTGCYMICWTPMTVILFLRGYYAFTPLVELLYNYFLTFLNMNYIFNPVVYSWMNPVVRVALVDMLRLLNYKEWFLKHRRQDGFDKRNKLSSVSTVSTVYSLA